MASAAARAQKSFSLDGLEAVAEGHGGERWAAEVQRLQAHPPAGGRVDVATLDGGPLDHDVAHQTEVERIHGALHARHQRTARHEPRPADQIEPPPSFGARIRAEFIAGMGKVAKGFVILLDADRVLSVEELAAIGGLADASPAQTM